MLRQRRIDKVLKEIDFHLAVMRENLEDETMRRAIEANKYHSINDWEYDPDPMEA